MKSNAASGCVARKGATAGYQGTGCLVEAIRSGDRKAEAELARRFSRGLLLKLRRLARNPALADDLHQETLTLVLEKIRCGAVRDPEKLPAFIYSTAYNLFIADRRKEARYSPLPTEREMAFCPLPAAAMPFNQMVAEQEARQVRQVLSELRFDRDRQILLRFYLRGESKEDICKNLEIEPEKFNLVLHRARQRMRTLWRHKEIKAKRCASWHQERSKT